MDAEVPTEMKVKLTIWALGALFLSGSASFGQLGGSLSLECPAALTDVVGLRLPGTWGNEDGRSVKVEIRQTTSIGGVYPPCPDTGMGDPLNPLIADIHMGEGVVLLDGEEDSGKFSKVIYTTDINGTLIFARVYDEPSPQESTYYLDSSKLFVPTSRPPTTIYFSFDSSAWNLISTSAPDVDTDGDGMPDQWELGAGLSPVNIDTDGDGWDDHFEVLHQAYLNPTNRDFIGLSVQGPIVTGSAPVELDPYTVSWQSVPGTWYRLEYHENQVDAEAYQESWVHQAETNQTMMEMDIDAWIRRPETTTGFFRVWAMPYYTSD
jgi:hypothetical protein